jgi:hypothetical protein
MEKLSPDHHWHLNIWYDFICKEVADGTDIILKIPSRFKFAAIQTKADAKSTCSTRCHCIITEIDTV